MYKFLHSWNPRICREWRNAATFTTNATTRVEVTGESVTLSSRDAWKECAEFWKRNLATLRNSSTVRDIPWSKIWTKCDALGAMTWKCLWGNRDSFPRLSFGQRLTSRKLNMWQLDFKILVRKRRHTPVHTEPRLACSVTPKLECFPWQVARVLRTWCLSERQPWGAMLSLNRRRRLAVVGRRRAGRGRTTNCDRVLLLIPECTFEDEIFPF